MGSHHMDGSAFTCAVDLSPNERRTETVGVVVDAVGADAAGATVVAAVARGLPVPVPFLARLAGGGAPSVVASLALPGGLPRRLVAVVVPAPGVAWVGVSATVVFGASARAFTKTQLPDSNSSFKGTPRGCWAP